MSQRREEVLVEFWADQGLAPRGLRAQLAREVFVHPMPQARCRLLACVPRGDAETLVQVLEHVRGARTRVAGVTCLVHARISGVDGRHSAVDPPPRR